MTTKSVIIRPLSDAAGAEVIGVDLRQSLDDAIFKAIHKALLDHCVIVLRDQKLTPEDHIAFSQRFGTLSVHVLDQFLLPGYPEILQISNKKSERGELVGLADAGRYWHSDLAYKECPSMGSLLYAREIPPAGKGGDTSFANMYKAYEALPKRMKDKLEGVEASYLISRKRFKDDNRIKLAGHQEEQTPEVFHPIVRTHPVTGRKALYVSAGHTDHVVGIEAEESRALLEMLNEHSTRPEFVYRHKWRVNDLVVWDNRCLMHLAEPAHAGYDRHMHRTTIEGDKPY